VDIEKSGSSYLENTVDLNFITLPFTIVMFLIGKYIYKYTQKYRISILFKQYHYITFFLFMITDRNIQRLAYYFGF
jgi:hypothetical protein